MRLWQTHISAQHTYGWVVHRMESDRDAAFIECFENMIIPWYLEPARQLAEGDVNNGFACLAVAIAAIETLDSYETRLDDNKSAHDRFVGQWSRFRSRQKRSENWPSDDIVYEKLRCGLYHNGMVSDPLFVHRGTTTDPVFIRDDERWKVCPAALVDRLRRDFNQYVTALRQGGTGTVDLAKFRAAFEGLFGETIRLAKIEGAIVTPMPIITAKTHPTGSVG